MKGITTGGGGGGGGGDAAGSVNVDAGAANIKMFVPPLNGETE